MRCVQALCAAMKVSFQITRRGATDSHKEERNLARLQNINSVEEIDIGDLELDLINEFYV